MHFSVSTSESSDFNRPCAVVIAIGVFPPPCHVKNLALPFADLVDGLETFTRERAAGVNPNSTAAR